MPTGLSRSCSALVICTSRLDRAPDDLVGGRLVDAAGVVVAAPDAGHVTARRHEPELPGRGIRRLDPRVVERAERRVVPGLVDQPLLHLLGVEPGRRVEDRDPIAHQLAVREHRQLDRLDRLEVDRTLLVRAHQIRYAEHGDLVDRLQPTEPGPVGDIADIVLGGQPRRRYCGRRWRGGERDLTVCGLLQGGAGDLLDLDHLRVRVHHRGDVRLAARQSQPVELLDLVAVLLDDDLEHVVGRVLAARVGDLDAHLTRRLRRIEREHPEPSQHRLRPGRQLLAATLAVAGVGSTTDPYDVTVAAAVQEIPVDGLRQIRAGHEAAERIGERGPVADQRRGVEGAVLGEPDERGHRRTDTLERASARFDFFHIHTW